MSRKSDPALISYPSQAAFGRILPKNKIYEHSGASTRLKALFVKQVEQIVWQYKLAPETINLAAKSAVPEIQVFAVRLKTADLNLDVLRCIDRAVQFPIIFEVSFDGRIQVIAAYKQCKITANAAATGGAALSDYFATAWLPADASRTPMPVALNLVGLYEQLLRSLMPLPAREQESFADLLARTEQITFTQREVEKTARKLAKEKQFNRKVEINALLRKLKCELEQLTAREEA